MQNSIDYSGERAEDRAGKDTGTLRQPGYTGKNCFAVTYAGRQVIVHAEDKTAALFFAAKHWGYSFRRPEYHQTATADKLGYQPGE